VTGAIVTSPAGAAPETPVAGDWRRTAAAGAGVVVLTFGGLAAWSALAPLDGAVVAQGMIVVESSRRVVQHLEGGIVQEILVRDGAAVTAGQDLVRLSPVQADATMRGLENEVSSALALEARLSAELARADTITFPPALLARSGEAEVARAIRDQERQFAERRASLRTQVETIDERIGQFEAEAVGLAEQLRTAVLRRDSIMRDIAAMRPVVEQGFIARLRLNEMERSRDALIGQIGSFQADIARNERATAEARGQRDAALRRFAEEAAREAATVRTQIATQRERLQAARDVAARLVVRAPQGGVVHGLRFQTVGGVVRPGEPILEIVPVEDALVVEGRLNPLDVTHVRAGGAAEVRLPAFKARTTPILIGTVTSVSPDVLEDTQTRSVSYRVRVSVANERFPAGIRDQLRPGMPAEILVATGERTLVEYLLQPLTDAFRRGMREP